MYLANIQRRLNIWNFIKNTCNMNNFSSKERFLASLLSSTPRLKLLVKRIYVMANALLYHKSYKYMILNELIGDIYMPFMEEKGESWGGYYDKFTINSNGMILSCLTPSVTKNKPKSNENIQLIVKCVETNELTTIVSTSSYNWQQGARAQWLSDDLVIYNSCGDNKYQAIVYSISQGRSIKIFDYPVQEAFHTDFFLSINYERVMKLRPDYGYSNLTLPSEIEMKDLKNDGIWFVDYHSQKGKMLHSLQDIVDCETKTIFDSCQHKVNHLMLNKKGDKFIFIHRYYLGKRRFDRLMCSDFNRIYVLIDDMIVSHCCWIDEDTVLGYWRYNGISGYYYCNVNTGNVSDCAAMTNLNLGDGHPSCYKDWIVFDTYPDKSRMQHLFIFNLRNNAIIPLLELYHGTSYKGECRCDLHPRFAENGKYISFDTVFLGKRQQCYINVGKILCQYQS